MTYNESSAFAYLRQANRDESVIGALNALLSAQPKGEEDREGTTAWHLLVCIQRIEEYSPELAPDLDAVDAKYERYDRADEGVQLDHLTQRERNSLFSALMGQ
jgi:hypothetical protein